MAPFDDLEKKLHLDEMNIEQRKKMFKKFIEKGGKVIEEKKPSVIKFDRSKQKLIKETFDKHKDKLKNSSYNQPTKKKPINKTGTQSITKKKKKHYFFVFLRGVFAGVFTLSKNFTKKFSKNMRDEFSPFISQINLTLNQIIKLDDVKRWELIAFINKINPMAYEFILRIYNLYKGNSLARIAEYFNRYHTILCSEIVDDLFKIYKELLIISAYREVIKNIIWKALQYFYKLTKEEPFLTRQKINKIIDTLFFYYFPKLHLIVTYNYGTNTQFTFMQMYEFAKVTEEEDIGSITKQLQEEKKEFLKRLEKEKEEKKRKLQEDIEKKELEKIPQYIKDGLLLIDNIVNSITMKKIKQDKDAKYLETNEKMLYFYFLMKEFDYEYSFIMTTSQIKFISRLESGVRTDIKSDFENLYVKYSEVSSLIKKYVLLMKEYHEVKDQFSDSPGILRQKLTNINTKRTLALNDIRARASVFFKEFAVVLQKLINDYKKDKNILDNGDDILHFQRELGERRKFEGKKVIQAIFVAFRYSSALLYYLNYDKLSKQGLYLDEDIAYKKEDKNSNTENSDNKNIGKSNK